MQLATLTLTLPSPLTTSGTVTVFCTGTISTSGTVTVFCTWMICGTVFSIVTTLVSTGTCCTVVVVVVVCCSCVACTTGAVTVDGAVTVEGAPEAFTDVVVEEEDGEEEEDVAAGEREGQHGWWGQDRRALCGVQLRGRSQDTKGEEAASRVELQQPLPLTPRRREVGEEHSVDLRDLHLRAAHVPAAHDVGRGAAGRGDGGGGEGVALPVERRQRALVATAALCGRRTSNRLGQGGCRASWPAESDAHNMGAGHVLHLK